MALDILEEALTEAEKEHSLLREPATVRQRGIKLAAALLCMCCDLRSGA